MRLVDALADGVPSSEASLWVVNEAHSGFCPAPSVLRYEIRYFGMAWLSSLSAPARRPS